MLHGAFVIKMKPLRLLHHIVRKRQDFLKVILAKVEDGFYTKLLDLKLASCIKLSIEGLRREHIYDPNINIIHGGIEDV